MEEIKKKLSLLRAHMSQLQEDIRALSSVNQPVVEKAQEAFLRKFQFPVSTDDQISEIEAFLNDDNEYRKAVRFSNNFKCCYLLPV